MMTWALLILAGLFECAWAIGLKYTQGFTRLYPSIFTVSAMVLSMVLLSYAMKHLPVGTAYAVWTGIGAVGAMLAGIVCFGDSAAWPRLLCAGLIFAGIIGLMCFDGG